MSKTLILFPPTTSHLGLLSDLKDRKDVYLFEVGYKETNVVGKIIRKIHLSKRINSFINVPNKQIWFREYTQVLFNEDISNVLIIDGALNYIDIFELQSIRDSNKKLKIYLLLINSMDADSPSIKWIRKFVFTFPWDEIFTFDPEDAVKYKITYKGFCYYSTHVIAKSNEDSFDVYFVGGLKGGREKTIMETFNFFSNHHLNCDYQLMVYGKSVPESTLGLTFHSLGWIPYEDVLIGVSHSNCILEILQEGQSGPSLRYFEAVCYNKKLLTNNKHIVNFPYYNPKFMKIFSDIHDIDIEWIKSNEPVDYGYQGDFSPNTLVDSINTIHCGTDDI